MVLKFKKKIDKEWEELTVEEKVNLLKYEKTKPEIGGLSSFWTCILIGIAFLMFTAIVSNTQKITNLENRYMLNASLNQTQMKGVEAGVMVANVYFFLATITFIIFFSLSLKEISKHKKKWKPFLESLRKDKEVKY